MSEWETVQGEKTLQLRRRCKGLGIDRTGERAELLARLEPFVVGTFFLQEALVQEEEEKLFEQGARQQGARQQGAQQSGCQCDACLRNGSELEGCSCGGEGECSGYCGVCSMARDDEQGEQGERAAAAAAAAGGGVGAGELRLASAGRDLLAGALRRQESTPASTSTMPNTAPLEERAASAPAALSRRAQYQAEAKPEAKPEARRPLLPLTPGPWEWEVTLTPALTLAPGPWP